jgi:hypothetical protein
MPIRSKPASGLRVEIILAHWKMWQCAQETDLMQFIKVVFLRNGRPDFSTLSGIHNESISIESGLEMTFFKNGTVPFRSNWLYTFK